MTLDWRHYPTPAVTWPEWRRCRMRWYEEEPLGGLFGPHNHVIRIDRVKQVVDILRSRREEDLLGLDWYCEANGFQTIEPEQIIGLNWHPDLRGLTICPKCTPKLGDLKGVDFGDCHLDGADFVECDLSGVIFGSSSLKAAGFFRCNLRSASLFEADLEGSYFDICDLRGTDLSYSHLSLVEFSSCKIAAADFSSASFTRLQTQGRILPDDIAVLSHQAGEHRASAVFRNCEHEARLGDRLRLLAERRSLKPLFAKPRTTFAEAIVEGVDWSRARQLERFILGEESLREMRISAIGHPLRKIGMFVWWLSSDYGRSIGRWLLLSSLLCVIFGLSWRVVDSSAQIPQNEMWGRPLCRASERVPITPFTRFYFSVVAYTTLGFGDVVPANGSGQILLGAEVVCGYLALGVLLSIVAKKAIVE
jgi:hypothetical protein